MDEFVGFLMVIVFVISSIITNILQNQKKKPGGKAKKGGLSKVLGDLITQIKQEIETQSQTAEASSRGQWFHSGSQPEKLDPVALESPASPPPLKRKPEKREAEKPHIPPAVKPAALKQPPSDAYTNMPLQPKRLVLPENELEKAIIWSEIIGKPVSLREEI